MGHRRDDRPRGVAAVKSVRATLRHLPQGLGIGRVLQLRPGRDRLAGWQDVLTDAGFDSDLVEVGDFTPESGTVAMERLLDGPEFDAVFAANDQMAFGAISALARAGRSVPGDVAVVGFDDDQFSRAARPTITTVHQPAREMGAVMAAHLLALLAGERVDQVTVLPTRLVVRESS